MKNLIIISVTFLFISGCSMLNRWNAKNCAQTNWGQYGYSEGSSGKQNNANVYSNACSKKGISIDISGYNKGYRDGLAQYCSYDAGKSAGSANRPTTRMCVSFDSYMKGYDKGMILYCSASKGYESGIKGKGPIEKCMVYKSYKGAFAQGEADFCKSKNGFNLGSQGEPFPERCEKSGPSFEKAYYDGRLDYLEKTLSKKERSLRTQKVRYEEIRDEIQDLQFEIGRLPRYSSDPNVQSDRSRLESEVDDLRDKRNSIRQKLESMDQDIADMRSEISSIKSGRY